MSINSTGTRIVPDQLSPSKTPLSSPKREVPTGTLNDSFHSSPSVQAPAKPVKNVPKQVTSAPSMQRSESELLLTTRFLLDKLPKLGSEILANLTMNSGLSHTLWGNKPMVWIGEEDTSLLKALQILAKSNVPLRKDFILLDASELFPGKGATFIINRCNLSNLLNDNPHLLDPWPKLKQYRSDKVIKAVFETINPVSRQLLTNNESLGTLLGYGPNNASKWSRMQKDNAPPQSEPELPQNSMLYEEMRKTPEELRQECTTSKIFDIADEICNSDTSKYQVYLPGFAAFDSSPETLPLITRYLEDCWLIRDHLKRQHELERLASGGNSLTSYRDFLTRLVQSSPSSIIPGKFHGL